MRPISNNRNRTLTPGASHNPQETVANQVDAVYARKRRSAAEVAGAQVSTGGGTQAGDGNGGGCGCTYEQWQYLVTADQSAGTPWTVDASDLGPGVLQQAAFYSPQFAGLRVSVGVSGDLPQSDDGSEGYPSWVWTDAETITIHNLAAFTSDGGFIGDLVRVTALR